MKRPLQVAVLCDFVEENWPSMDLVAEMLVDGLASTHASEVNATRVCPPFLRRFSYPARVRSQKLLFNADRILNRFVDYPRTLKRIRHRFDVFHIIDHSYAFLVHAIPAQRTLVTCHDLESFRCALEPRRCRRALPFRIMAARIIDGFQRAARVACDSETIREEVIRYRLVPPQRAVTIVNGVNPAYLSPPGPAAEGEATRLIGPVCRDSVDLLHVGSTVARKRIDILLQVFAGLRKLGRKRA